MLRVYVAGPYDADNVVDVLENMRRGMRACVEILLAGFSPFCPWLDYHFQLMLRSGEVLKKADYQEYSLSWLEVSDAMLVLSKSEGSGGVQREITFAEKKGIPVFHNRKDLFGFLER